MLTRDKDRVEPSFERNAIKYVTNLQAVSITNNSLVFCYLHVYTRQIDLSTSNSTQPMDDGPDTCPMMSRFDFRRTLRESCAV